MDVARLTRHLLQNSASHIIAGWIVMLSQSMPYKILCYLMCNYNVCILCIQSYMT